MNCGDPVLTNNFAGPWLKTSVVMLLTKQMSSATVCRWGNVSPISAPDCPHLLNLRCVPRSLASFLMNANRLFLTYDSGITWNFI